jgi:hypothetical protein
MDSDSEVTAVCIVEGHPTSGCTRTAVPKTGEAGSDQQAVQYEPAMHSKNRPTSLALLARRRIRRL